MRQQRSKRASSPMLVSRRNIPDYEVLRIAVHLQRECNRLTTSRQRHPLTVEDRCSDALPGTLRNVSNGKRADAFTDTSMSSDD